MSKHNRRSGLLSAKWFVVVAMVLMTAASVVCMETGLTFLASTGVRIFPLRIGVIALACYSIALGFMLGFAGQNGAFKRDHPARYESISHTLRTRG